MTSLAALAGTEKPDLVLLIAAKTGFLLAGRFGAILLKKDCMLAQVDVDAAAIGRTHAIDNGIVADVCY